MVGTTERPSADPTRLVGPARPARGRKEGYGRHNMSSGMGNPYGSVDSQAPLGHFKSGRRARHRRRQDGRITAAEWNRLWYQGNHRSPRLHRLCGSNN